MPKRIDPETDKQIFEMLDENRPKTEIGRKLGVSTKYIRKRELSRIDKPERGETILQTYEMFGERERLKLMINDAFSGVEHLMLQCAARDLCSMKSRVRMSLTKTPNGLTLEFSFDDPKSLASQGWVETWISSNELHNFLLTSYLAERWKSKYEFISKTKNEALKLVEEANLEQAKKIAQRFQVMTQREFNVLVELMKEHGNALRSIL